MDEAKAMLGKGHPSLAAKATPVIPRELRMPSATLTRCAALAFAFVSLATAALLFVGVFVGLPARWWPVDTGAVLLVVLELAAALGLITGARWGVLVARIAGTTALLLGLVAVTLLAVTASWLGGVYGPVGKGGAVVLGLVAALVVPYCVLLPAVQLWWLRGRTR
jgi:hypothetical protein